MLPSLLSLPSEHLELLRIVAREASARGVAAYVVGGYVRDLILKRPGLDLDIVVEGDAIGLARVLAKKYGGKVTAHGRFGTAVWRRDDGRRTTDDGRGGKGRGEKGEGLLPSLDFITARRESYASPAALPDVTASTLADDLGRRDFTINTLAVRLDGEHFGRLVDPYHGQVDLERGLVRVLHDGSFIDDPTRMLRAVRYEQRYGFQIEAHTLALIGTALPAIARLSAERVRHELDLSLDEPRAAEVLARLQGLGVLKAVCAALPWSADAQRRLEAGLRAIPAGEWGLEASAADVPLRRILGYSLWLLQLSAAEIDAVQARLLCPAVTLKAVRAAAGLWADLPALRGASPSKWERLEGVPVPAVYAVYLASTEPALETYAVRWRQIQPQTDGEALKALGIPPGPAYKKILRRLRAAWLDGEVASAEQERKLLERLRAT